MRWKLFLRHLVGNDADTIVFLAKNSGQVDHAIQEILKSIKRETFELSHRLHECCDRIHQATTDMYEAMHPDGEPHGDFLVVEQDIRDLRSGSIMR